MSIQANTTFAQQYGENVLMLSQQKGSVLEKTVYTETGIRGEFAFQDQVGVATYNSVINRNGDSPLNNTPFQRRRVQMVPRDYGDLVDKMDKVQMLIDPESATAKAAAASMGRAKDDIIISQLFATAYTNSGLDGVSPTTVAFPGGNIIAVNDRTFQDEGNSQSGNSSLTVSKLLYARDLFGTANVDMTNDELWCPVSQQCISALLTATPVTSIFFNSVHTLVTGNVAQFSGINLVHTELVNTTGQGVSLLSGGYQLIPVYAKSGVFLGIGEDIISMIEPRPDKRFSTYVYFQMLMGATRLEEVKVVQLICDPTKTF